MAVDCVVKDLVHRAKKNKKKNNEVALKNIKKHEYFFIFGRYADFFSKL